MTTNDTLDFSMKNVPSEWHEAAHEAPESDGQPLRHKRVLAVIPTFERADLLTGTIAAIAMSVVAGVAWFAMETRGHLVTPWLAIPLALLMAVAVRLGCGRPEPEVRATLATIFYLLALFGTIYMIERYDFILTYGYTPDLTAAENALVRDRLTQPETVLAWVTGLLIVVQTSYLSRRRLSF